MESAPAPDTYSLYSVSVVCDNYSPLPRCNLHYCLYKCFVLRSTCSSSVETTAIIRPRLHIQILSVCSINPAAITSPTVLRYMYSVLRTECITVGRTRLPSNQCPRECPRGSPRGSPRGITRQSIPHTHLRSAPPYDCTLKRVVSRSRTVVDGHGVPCPIRVLRIID